MVPPSVPSPLRPRRRARHPRAVAARRRRLHGLIASLALAGAPVASAGRTVAADDAETDRVAAAVERAEAAARQATAEGRDVAALGHWAMVARLAPEHEAAWARLRETAPGRPPLESPALASARAALPRGFREERTTHFVVLSDADPQWTLEVGRRLEHVHASFESFARRLGLDPVPLRHRLVCIVFEDRRDFARFGRETDGVAASWAHGYYSPRRDRVVLYQPDDRADRFAEARAVAALMHETAHQLSFHRLVQDVTVQQPLWLNEGLATSFEAAEDARSCGPWDPFEPRERRLARLVAEDRLLPLGELVGLVTLGAADAERIERVYGQCYGLFTWLATTRPAALRAFLDAMHAEPPGAVESSRLIELFETHVGRLAAIESAFGAHLRRRVAARRDEAEPRPGTGGMRVMPPAAVADAGTERTPVGPAARAPAAGPGRPGEPPARGPGTSAPHDRPPASVPTEPTRR